MLPRHHTRYCRWRVAYIGPMNASWRERLRYRVDTLLARGSTGPLLWLGGATALLTVVGALVFWALGIEWGERSGFGESLWRSFVIAIGKGVIGNATWTQRIVTLVFIFASLFLAGSLVGLLVSAINRRLDAVRRGRSRVLERDQTVVLGASARLMPVLDELLAHPTSTSPVVVLSEHDKLDLEDDFLTRHPKPKRRVVFRNGTPSRQADLALVGVEHAKSVIVLNNGSSVDAVTVRRALAANSFSPDGVHVVAEMSNQRIARSVRDSTVGQVATVCIDATVADMLTQAIRAPGLALMFDELLSFEGSEFYVMPAEGIAGRSWADLSAAVVDAVPLGVVRDGRAMLLPGSSFRSEASDSLIVLATNPSPVIELGRTHVAQPDVRLTDAHAPAKRVMVLGWSTIAESMLRELDGFLGDQASVTVLADQSMLAADFPDADSFRHSIRFQSTKHNPDEIRAVIDDELPDVLVVVGYLSQLTEDEADALTLLTLHTLAQATPHQHRPRVVAQILNNEVGALAPGNHDGDYVVTDALVSRMLVHLARDGELSGVFDELFDAAGPSARLLSCTPGRYRFGDLKMALTERHMTLVGVMSKGAPELNLADDTTVDFTSADRLIVFGRFDLR